MAIIKKAVIPAAGLGTRFLPITKSIPKELIPILDTPTIDFVVQEAIDSGIEEILIIVNWSKHSLIDYYKQNTYLEDFLLSNKKYHLYDKIKQIHKKIKIHFKFQDKPRGLGDAILIAKSFTKNDPFIVMLGDDIILHDANQPTVTKQIMNIYEKTFSNILSVRECLPSEVQQYGVISPSKFIDKEKKLCVVNGIIEKPSIKESPSNLVVTGRYLFTKDIYSCIEQTKQGLNGEIQITDAIKMMLKNKIVYAWKYDGKYYDIGSKKGFVIATIDFALNNPELKKYVLNHIKNKIKTN